MKVSGASVVVDAGSAPVAAVNLYGGVSVSNYYLNFPGNSGQYACLSQWQSTSPAATFAVHFLQTKSATCSRVFDLGKGSAAAACTGQDKGVYVNFGDACGYNTGDLRVEIAGGSGYLNAAAPGALPLNTWVFIVLAVSASGSWNVYKDGPNNVLSVGGKLPVPTSSTPFYHAYLGKSQYSDPMFPGYIASFQVCDTAEGHTQPSRDTLAP